MRILHLLNDCQEIGNGIINAAIDLACKQAEAGFEVAVVSSGGEYEDLMKRYGIQHFYLDKRRNPVQICKSILRFRHIVKTFSPDIVHAHMMTGVVLARFCRRGPTEYKLVSTVHNEYQLSSILMGLADRVIAVSRSVAESMGKRGIPMQKISVVANGTIGSPRCRAIAEIEPMPLNRPAITTVAGLNYRKGIAELIEAFVQIADAHPGVHLYLVGNGPDRKDFEQQASRSPYANRIHFEGFQPEPQRYLLSTDVFVLASNREPFGLVLSEAREAGCAIVASEVDGIPEVLEDGKAGLLVPPRDISALSTALSHLLSSPTELERWKQHAKEHVEWLSVDRVHQETLTVYQHAILQSFALANRKPGSNRMRLGEE
jgi:glycosyltransferase involved in cell wall biosynthesis